MKTKKTTPTIVQGNTFETKIWDAKAIEAVNNVAKALVNMTELFKAQNINITCLNVNAENHNGTDN